MLESQFQAKLIILPMTAPEAEVLLDRIDAVVLEVNGMESVRDNNIKFVKGNPSSAPSRPTLTNEGNVHQYPLCYIYRKYGTAVIKQADITPMVGTESTPFVTGILQTISFEELMAESTDYEEYLHKLLEREMEAKDSRAVECRIRNVKFPCKKYLEDLDTGCMPKDLQNKLPELATLDFIKNGRNVIFYGNPGTGKTHTSIALGIKACLNGYRVLFTTIPLLITQLKECKNSKTLMAYERKFEKYDLVIADELGYISFDKEGAELLFSNLSLRASRKATIITTNMAFDRWEEIFGDPVITGAMVDRLTHRAILVNMEGDSYRLRESMKLVNH